MKKITAVIKPFRLDKVVEALTQVGIGGLTVSEVRGSGHQKGHGEFYRVGGDSLELVPKFLLETVVPDDLVVNSVIAITRAARTGKIGDGKIFVSSIEEMYTIRTGERGR